LPPEICWASYELTKPSALCNFSDGLLKKTPKFSTHIVEGPAKVRGDRDDVEQLLLERLQMQQRMLGRVDLAPKGGVNKLQGGVQAEIGASAVQKRERLQHCQPECQVEKKGGDIGYVFGSFADRFLVLQTGAPVKSFLQSLITPGNKR
jgi:hypothetical protein